MPPAQQMQVQVQHGLSSTASVIEHRAVAGEQVAFRGQLRRHQLQFPQQRLVTMLRIVQRAKMSSRTNQNMRRRLRIDVLERENIVILID